MYVCVYIYTYTYTRIYTHTLYIIHLHNHFQYGDTLQVVYISLLTLVNALWIIMNINIFIN